MSNDVLIDKQFYVHNDRFFVQLLNEGDITLYSLRIHCDDIGPIDKEEALRRFERRPGIRDAVLVEIVPIAIAKITTTRTVTRY